MVRTGVAVSPLLPMITLLAGLCAGVATAHTGAPAVLTLTQAETRDQWALVWEHPMDQTGPGKLDSDCQAAPWSGPEVATDRLRWWTTLQCGAAQEPVVRLSSEDALTAIVRTVPQGTAATHVLIELGPTPAAVPRQDPPHTTALHYLRAGALHVAAGLDHILLLIGLGCAAVQHRSPHRATARTVAAFGVGHAVTVVVIGLGLLRPPVAWCEAAIGATLILLGRQLWQGTSTPTWRWAGACGLIHGLGFGSALAELGLPLQQRLLALLGFNAGVDVAQAVISAATVGALSLPWICRQRARLSAGLAVLISTVGFTWLWGLWTS